MPSRLAACESCRKGKLACDHKRPACTRCKNNNKARICIYRTSPFKRKRNESPAHPADHLVRSPAQDIPTPPLATGRTIYPNPGYLGSSSHVAIFNHIPPDGDHTSTAGLTTNPVSTPSLGSSLDDTSLAFQGAEIMKQLLDIFQMDTMVNLVMFWLAKGVNLALAEPFVELCAKSMKHVLEMSSQSGDWHQIYAMRLLRNSSYPLVSDHGTTLSQFVAQFLDDNMRWETLGIFFSAVVRATTDIPIFPTLYITKEERYHLQGLATKLSDRCLEICLSLDCLNDLQLILQYENFIVHAFVDGDQSYHSWRRLGDVIASIFALGYHEKIKTLPAAPLFLVELRRTAFARIYSADKNVAIFLGRSPRMSKRFCHFQIPSNGANLESGPLPLERWHGVQEWGLDEQMSLRTDTRWSALCASLKEEILEIHFEDGSEDLAQRTSSIHMRAKAAWDALPPHFQLLGSLKQSTKSPFERDLLVSIRLNYLHVQFLIRYLLLDCPAEPDISIIEVSQEMLSLVVEAILLRDQLINSGTNLMWKVVHYGLPAAGITLLAMLRRQHVPDAPRVSRAKVLQHLSIFVAEVQMGTLIGPDEPDYALLSKATQTIGTFLDSLINSEDGPYSSDTSYPDRNGVQMAGEWAPSLGLDSWDFEIGFWQNLGDHHSLLNLDLESPVL